MSDLSNVIPNRGRRTRIRVDIDDEGVEVAPLDDKRSVLVLFNVGPNTAWGAETLEDATPEEGFPLKMNGGFVEDASIDAWFFKTEEGETASLRGWKVAQP